MEKLNLMFRSSEGTVFAKISADEAKSGFQGNYITVIDNKVVAVADGKEVPVPEILYNEIGVGYLFVDFYKHALKMAKKHGVYYAVKQEPIRVWKNVLPGEAIHTVIDGFEEHRVELDENSVAAQNVIKNEFYAIPKSVLAEKYRFDHSEFDYDVYVPKSDVYSEWVYSDVNVFGVLWGGLEFLTTPMINITKPDDCYGCNYVVWWGNDGRLASYKVLKYFRGCGKVYYPESVGEPVSVSESSPEPPKVLIY
ncbi:MAG: hypothetical protein J6A09_03580 [Alphaproteobacteria bacterium]|nr:hypothetical protein [Alphaproteobacteria bacterium]